MNKKITFISISLFFLIYAPAEANQYKYEISYSGSKGESVFRLEDNQEEKVELQRWSQWSCIIKSTSIDLTLTCHKKGKIDSEGFSTKITKCFNGDYDSSYVTLHEKFNTKEGFQKHFIWIKCNDE